jgi:hypothetical protein
LHNGLRLARQANEFNIHGLLAIHVYDRTEVASTETVLGDISFKDDCIEFANAHEADVG